MASETEDSSDVGSDANGILADCAADLAAAAMPPPASPSRRRERDAAGAHPLILDKSFWQCGVCAVADLG